MKHFALAFLFAATHAVSQTIPDKVYREILSAQDGRDTKSLTAFLSHKQPEIRARAAFACASVQDTSHVAILNKLLFDNHYSVRTAAALALGQMNFVIDSAGRTAISAALVKRLAVEQSSRVAARIAEALGKVGNESSLDILVAAGRSTAYVGVRSEAALSVGRYAYRGIKSKTATQFVADMIEALGNDGGWKAAYALMRIGDSTFLSKHSDADCRETH
jgi:HEAT repeat protein